MLARFLPRSACCTKKNSSRKPGSAFLIWAFVALLPFRNSEKSTIKAPALQQVDHYSHLLRFQEDFMRTSFKWRFRAILSVIFLSASVAAQSVGNSGSINGSVVDPTGAVVPNAKVQIRNPVSGFDRSTNTENSGRFAFSNVPFNPYPLTITATAFSTSAQDLDPPSPLPSNSPLTLNALP